MPPKPRFKREEITEAALAIVSKGGLEALTAKTLQEALNCSASPIFTVFDSMKEIEETVRVAAMRRFESYQKGVLPQDPVFKQIGMKMVLFGMQEPKLYQLLFMRENGTVSSFDDMMGVLGSEASVCIEAIKRDYGLGEREAKQLFENVWIYTFGAGALCATKACRFSAEDLSRMLSTQFQAMLGLLRSGKPD